jgi:hypothetical protein
VTRSVLLGAAVVSGLACAERREADAAGQGGEAAAPADSLVMLAGDSVGIWFTLARPDSGGGCTERTIEIRRGTARVPVPLLYTGGAPEFVNDTTIRARLWNDCRPGDAYLVDLRTGRPVRERR